MDEFSLYQWLVLGPLALIAFMLWAIARGGGNDLVDMHQRLETIDSHLTEVTGGLQSIVEAVHAQTNHVAELPSDHGSSDRWELPSDLGSSDRRELISDLGSSDRRELISELRVIRKLLEAQHRHSGLTDLE